MPNKNDDVTPKPRSNWRSHAHLLFGNWINEIYQTTPFDIEAIGGQVNVDTLSSAA